MVEAFEAPNLIGMGRLLEAAEEKGSVFNRVMRAMGNQGFDSPVTIKTFVFKLVRRLSGIGASPTVVKNRLYRYVVVLKSTGFHGHGCMIVCVL